MEADETAIRELVNRWMDASREGDTETVLGLMAEDVVFMVVGHEPFGKEEFVAASAAMKDMRIDGNSDIRELKVMGDWAYARSYIDLTVTPKTGQAVRRAGYALTLFRKERDGRWVLTRDANMVTTQP
jgi:uncharacterized protein (TIGR02246 family)